MAKKKKNTKKYRSTSLIQIEKNKIRKTNPSIFYFNLDSYYIYESRYCSFFYNKLSDKNVMKPKPEEIIFIKNKVNSSNKLNEKEEENGYILIPQNIFEYFNNRTKIIPQLDERANNVKTIIDNNKNNNLSCRKISNIYLTTYGKKKSKTTVNEIIRNKLGLRFLKTNIMNKVLNSKKSIEQSFFVLKILIRHLKLGGDIIYIDESTFYTKNTYFKTWRKKTEHIFHEIKDSGKTNLILAISPKKVIHWTLQNCNTDAKGFKDFIIEMVDNLDELEIKNTLFLWITQPSIILLN